MKQLLGRLLKSTRKPASRANDLESFEAVDRGIIEAVAPYTMTSALRVESLIRAVRYCEESKVPGAYVECGVWRGGSVLAIVLTLLEMDVSDRDIYLYDTFEGMTVPTEADTSSYEGPALTTWKSYEAQGEQAWGSFFNEKTFNIQDVRDLLTATGYPEHRLHFVKGPVEETIPGQIPSELALLRLDTDWYESTRHELVHLYPRLVQGGVMIIDDYGHWDGCRKAVDEYLAQPEVSPVLLQRIDYTGRLAIKTNLPS